VGESITVTDNRTGASIEIPIEFGGISAAEFAKLLPGVWFYDPGFTTTAACESAITFVDGDVGILKYRGYPIEQLAEHSSYLEVATSCSTASCRPRRSSRPGEARSPRTPSSTRTCGSASWRASTTTRTRWGCWSRQSRRCRPSTPTRRRSSTRGTAPPDRAPHRQDADARRSAHRFAWACRSSTPTTTSATPRTSCP